MIEILLDKKQGTIWDLGEVVTNITWSTKRAGGPASLEFTLVNSGIYQIRSFTIDPGDIIRMRKGDQNVFSGFVFAIRENQEREIRIKAYDQVRYLLNKDTYVFKNATTGDVIRQIASDFHLQVGQIDDTGYPIPTMVEDGQTLLDIIEKANILTLINTNRHYVFFDDFGQLSLRLIDDFLADVYIGDGSLLTGFDYERDIDKDTYNLVKLYRDNQESGRREVFIAKDSASIANWGLLQLYQSVDEQKNIAQINELLSQLMTLRNRERKSLKLTAIGDVRIRAGTYVPLVIEALGINQPMLVEEATHTFSGGEHTMSLTLKVIERR